MTEPKVIGNQNPDVKKEENQELTKEDIMFKVDEEGNVMPETVEVKVYDRVLDDDIFNTTLELDNALSMYEATEKAFKQIANSNKVEIQKLTKRISELEKIDKLTSEQTKTLNKARDDLKEREKSLQTLEIQNIAKINAYKDKITESRKDLNELETLREDQIKVKTIQAIPCTTGEAHKYFNKRMYKNDKGEWVEPTDREDITYISYLLNKKIASPKMDVKEWENSKAEMRLSCREAIAEISGYKRVSSKELLVERRRSEKLKNILGESQQEDNISNR